MQLTVIKRFKLVSVNCGCDKIGGLKMTTETVVIRFEEWWPKTWKFVFGMKWLEAIVKPFAKTAYEVGRMHERREIWKELNSMVKPGHLNGNGCDGTAQRNGIILAANIVIARDNVWVDNDEGMSYG